VATAAGDCRHTDAVFFLVALAQLRRSIGLA
jgi:hypothetical protein